MNFDLDVSLVTKISKDCKSQSLKSAPSYFRFVKYHAGSRFFGFSLDDTAFLFGSFARSHFRLAEIAVAKENQGKGYGSFMLSVLFEECAKRGINVITLRTPKNESSYLWYAKFGAKIVGVNDDDYEMRICW